VAAQPEAGNAPLAEGAMKAVIILRAIVETVAIIAVVITICSIALLKSGVLAAFLK
jgi:hypothetical protein